MANSKTKHGALQAIYFDLDGTLMDSERASMRSVARVFAKKGVNLLENDLLGIVGRKLDLTLSELSKLHGFDHELPQMRKEILFAYREELNLAFPIIPGAVEAVRAFSKECPLALVSGSLHEEVEWALSKMGILQNFECIQGGDDYAKSKPAPDGYLAAILELGIPPENSVSFEDSTFGIEAAKKAGLSVIAVGAANHFHLDQSQADERIPDFTRIDFAWLKRWKARLR